MATAQFAPETNQNRVLSEAVVRVAGCWQLTNEQLGAILGLSPATASRLRSGGFQLDRSGKAFELGQYLIRLFRILEVTRELGKTGELFRALGGRHEREHEAAGQSHSDFHEVPFGQAVFGLAARSGAAKHTAGTARAGPRGSEFRGTIAWDMWFSPR